MFCYCLLGGGWKARCFVSVFWFGWIAMHAVLEMYNHCPYSHVKFKTG